MMHDSTRNTTITVSIAILTCTSDIPHIHPRVSLKISTMPGLIDKAVSHEAAMLVFSVFFQRAIITVMESSDRIIE